MVRFGPTTNILSNTTNQYVDNKGMGSGNETSKKRFPVTPHPSKQQPKDDDGSLPSETTNACTSQVSSPQMTHSTQDNAEGGDEEEEDDEWKHFVESATPQDAPNLQTFLGAKSIRETAKENFSTGLEECIAGLNEAMINEMLQDSVVAVHQEQGERFEAYEADIIATMKSNHIRRKDLLKCMDDANVRWDRQYKRLRGSILLMETPKNDDTIPGDPADAEGKMTNEVHKDQQRGDPEWEELAEFEPTRGNVRCFLEARERLQNAEEALSQSLDEIHAGLRTEADAIVQIVVDFHNHHESNCLSYEDDIQYHLVQNCKRRTALQKSLEESAKQAQGLFANLLSRLSQKL